MPTADLRALPPKSALVKVRLLTHITAANGNRTLCGQAISLDWFDGVEADCPRCLVAFHNGREVWHGR